MNYTLLMKVVFSIFIFVFLFTQLAWAEYSDLDSLKYKKINSLNFEYQINALEKKWLLKVKNIELQNKELIGAILNTPKGLLYHHEDGAVYYAEGLSKDEFIKAIKRSDRVFDYYYVLNLLVPKTYAADVACDTSFLDFQNPGFEKLGNAFGKISVNSLIKKCDFSISNIFESQLDSFKELGSALFSGNIWSTISNATNSFLELIPMIKDQVLPALSELIQYAPQLAEKMICNFTEKKVGALVLSTFTGGITTGPLLAATLIETAKLVEKISILTKNRKLLSYVMELEKRKLLNKDIIESLSKLLPDIPANLKIPANNRFRNPDNKKNHYDKHGKELGVKSEEEYEAKAKAFAQSDASKHSVGFTEKNGDQVKWDTETDEMLVLNKYGNFVTYFKLNCKNKFEKLLYVVLPKEQKSTVCK
ncbi:MAG: hypothetical protein K2Q18_02775 [Bdellovibrionales bacterium]|nr:hypothetical protein [Bdellovibrionales bacterium]